MSETVRPSPSKRDRSLVKEVFYGLSTAVNEAVSAYDEAVAAHEELLVKLDAPHEMLDLAQCLWNLRNWSIVAEFANVADHLEKGLE